jgi:hypothetical protein
MKINIKKFALLVIFLSLPFFFVQCDNSKEKSGGKDGDVQEQAVVQKETEPQTQAQPKSMLPEKLLNLELTDDQRAQCEAAYQEIFTPDIIAQRKEMVKKLKGLEKDSDAYKNQQKEISETFKPYYAQFNKKLKIILTPEQQEEYFVKKETQKEDKI